MPLSDFPRLPVEPGRYAAEWFIGGSALAGEIELSSARPARLTVFGEAKPIVWKRQGRSRSAGFPQDHVVPEITGRLRTGHDVVATDAHLSVWMPQRTNGSARSAVVGLGIAETPRRYPSLRLQVTGADLLFGTPPLKSVQFPDPKQSGFQGEFGATLNARSVQTWRDRSLGITITCSYEGNFSLTNRYRHQLTFAPVIEFEGEPATVDEWMDFWVRPLLELTALATRAPQRLSWVTVHAAPSDSQERATRHSGVVFGSGIWQEPFTADEPAVRPDPDWKPLFTLGNLRTGLPSVLRVWREQQASANPFLDLYRSVLMQPDLPPRARFLYLIQALEGLHGFEHRAADESAQATFQEKRQRAVVELDAAKLPPKTLRFIKDNWSRRRLDSLDRRLRELIADMPEAGRDAMEHRSLPLAAELEGEGEKRLDQMLRRLRNDLSHGTRQVEEDDLAPWVELLERIAQHHLLSRLGIS